MAVGQSFQESEEYELLEPYADGDGLVGGYRIEAVLAQDPWRHTTYEASGPDGRRVALKLLDAHFGVDRRSAKRFERRLRQRASIEHPHLLAILGWGKLGDRYYLVMPLGKAPSLGDILRDRRLEPGAALRLLAQIADALAAAHDRGLVHRDLAPDRVMVEPRDGGHILLGDFGIADPEWRGPLPEVTGSAPYLPPETFREEPLTPRSNVYSLACVLVECLSGSPPFVSDQPGVVAYAHVAEPPPRLSERCPNLPSSIDDVVAAAMAKEPAERLTSPRQFVAAVAVALGEPIPTPVAGNASGRHGDGAATPSRGAPPEAAVAEPRSRREQKTGRSFVRSRLPLRLPYRLDGLVAALALALTVAASAALGLALGRSADDASGGASSRALPAEPDAVAVRQTIDTALERLDARRAASRRRLAAARTPRQQAAEAARLQAAHRAAGGMVRGAGGGAVAAALRDAADAYGRLAAAARGADRRRYAAARRAVRRSEDELGRAVARLNRRRG